MSAIEFLFLALGLVVGVPVGAALLNVIRARPPVREVRLTVTRNALPPRAAAVAVMTTPLDALTDPVTVRTLVADPHVPLTATVREGRPARAVPVGRGTDPLLTTIRAWRPVATAAMGTGPGVVAEVREPVAAGVRRAVPDGGEAPALRMAEQAFIAPTSAGGPIGGSADPAAPSPSGPCEAERRLAEERCGRAAEARERAELAAMALADARRQRQAVLAEAEMTAREATPERVAEAKEAARRAFRVARAEATSGGERERAAAAWLRQIDQLNERAARAGTAAQRATAEAAVLAAEIERLEAAAEAADGSAAGEEKACLEARAALATCEAAAAAKLAGPAGAQQATPVREIGTPAAEALTGAPHDDAPRPRDPATRPAIFRLLERDDAALRAVVDAIGTDAVERDDLRRLLGELVHAVVARAIEEGALDFPADHPFWGHFGRRQGREITRALASYGFRFDGRGGFVDGRVPSRRELSVVIDQAGLDPMRVRRWPEEPGRLFEGATVAAGEFLATGAPSLSLAEMVALLGQRPEALDELWNAWGRIGPRLLEPLPRRAPSA